jgi:hypothetical protein
VIIIPSCSSDTNNPFGSLNTSSTWNTTQRSVLGWVLHGDRISRYNRSFFFPEFINDSLFIFEKFHQPAKRNGNGPQRRKMNRNNAKKILLIQYKLQNLKNIMRWVGLRLAAPSNRTLF